MVKNVVWVRKDKSKEVHICFSFGFRLCLLWRKKKSSILRLWDSLLTSD